MKHVFLIVEGQSEELFYKKVVAEHLRSTHFFQVTIMPNKRNQTARRHKGGTVTYELCIKNIKRFLNSATHCHKVVLVFDYYGLHTSFMEGYTGTENTEERVNYIINRIEQQINDRRFFVFLQVHEFEAFLFSHPEVIAHHYGQKDKTQILQSILKSFGENPEAINNSASTSPSHRISSMFPTYGKTTGGVVIAQKIGIGRISEKCSGFQRFLDKLQ